MSVFNNNLRLSDKAERDLERIQTQLEHQTDCEWGKEDTLHAILSLCEVYGVEMLRHLTDDEIQRLSDGDTAVPMQSKARQGVEDDADHGKVPVISMGDVMANRFEAADNDGGGLVDKLRD